MILRYTIHKAICDFYGLELVYIFKDVRETQVVEKRQLFHYLCNKFKVASLTKIGGYCNVRQYNHATVLNSIKTISNLIDVDPKLKKEVQEIETRIINKY